MSSAPLHRKFISGFAWTSITKWLTQGVTWAALFFTARMLSPADFGMVEMAGFLAVVAQVLGEFGLGSAVLQMRDLDENEIGQIHTAAQLFGLLAVALSWLAAHPMALFFHQPRLESLILWNSLSFVVLSLQAVPQGLLQRDLDYRRLSLIEGAQTITQAVLLVVCAWAGLEFWSFLVSTLTGRVLSTGMAWYWKPVRFRMPQRAGIARALAFGLDVSGARLSGTMLLMADGFLIGRLLGDSLLGVYRLAINLAAAPADKVAQLVMRVTGPLFASLQENPAQMGRYFFVLSDILTMVLAPLTAGFVLTSEDLIAVMLGPKWAAAAAPARWLAVYMTLRSLASLAQQVLVSLRETRFFLWMSVLGFVLLPAGFYFAAGAGGLEAVAAVWLLTSPVLLLPQLLRALNRMECSVWSYLRALSPALVATAVMSVVVMGVIRFLSTTNLGSGPAWARLAVEVSVGGVVYLGVLWPLHRAEILRYIDIIKKK